MKLAVVAIHGMGSQQPGYSNDLFNELRRLLGPDHLSVVWKEVYWADLTEARQQKYLADARAAQELDQNRIRNFVVSALGDAVAYQRVLPWETEEEYEKAKEVGTYYLIHERIAGVINELYNQDLGGKSVPLVVLAHSLGGHIFTNYYWDVRHPSAKSYRVETLKDEQIAYFERLDWLAGLVTFGCNIPLFTFALDRVVPIDFPPKRLPDRYRQEARWLNMFDPDDVLGYPLRPLNAAYAKVVSEDIAIDVGNAFIGWTPVSHTQYWTDNDFTHRVAEFLKKILAA
jgi:hypothetical protein